MKIDRYYKKTFLTTSDAMDLVIDARKCLNNGKLEEAVKRLDLAKPVLGFVCLGGGMTNMMNWTHQTYRELRQRIKNGKYS
ncbi:hypothetical protein KW787_03725 [Candidatus Pacearchaeota archaeon]|nr:hypothetical protein [Candidatus Pacearchaeota archaeon]